MTHAHYTEDAEGQIVGATYFCSDYCHQDFCATMKVEYGGWNGCHEMDAPEWCENCGTALGYYDMLGTWVTPEQQEQEKARGELYVGLINAILKP